MTQALFGPSADPRLATSGAEVVPSPLVGTVVDELRVVPGPAAATPAPKPPTRPTERPFFMVSSVLTIIGVMALTFVLTLTVLGAVRHARDQQTAFADFRAQLANATAPVTQTDERGRLHPLGTPVAVLDVPQLALREVVFEGTTSGVLRSGPGHRRDTPLPGQEGISVILGRQAAYGGPFGELATMRPGQVFSVTTGQGTHRYRVTHVRRAGDPVPPPLAAGKGRLTLMTAAGDPWEPEGVLRVDADLITDTQPAGPRPLTVASLPLPERALQGDPSALIWVLLVGQLLLAATVTVTWARYRWGGWQAWTAGGPLLFAVGVALADQIAKLLPNLM